MSALLHNLNPILRVWVYLALVLATVLVIGCGSEPASAPTPTPARDAVIKAIEDVLSPTPLAASIPTATASIPAPPPSSGRPVARSMAPDFTVPSADGDQVSLAGLLEDHSAVVLVFYRGFF